MYTIPIGRRLLEVLSEERGYTIDPRQFFEEEFWPVMFNVENDSQQLMEGLRNTRFGQNLPKQRFRNSGLSVPQFRKMWFYEGLDEVTSGLETPHGGILMGGMASGPSETTYGQVTNIVKDYSKEDYLYSWFGAACAIGFEGGFNFLSLDKTLLLYIQNGWKYYRKLLLETPDLKGRNLSTWNSIWISEGLKYHHYPEQAYSKISNLISNYYKKSEENTELKRPKWIKTVFALANTLGGKENLTHYGYKFDKSNTSLGFLAFQLPKVKRLKDIWNYLLPPGSNKAIEEVYQTQYDIKYAAQYGQLGLQALMPKDLPKYLGVDANNPRKLFDQDYYSFHVHLTWLTAMLNNEELLEQAEGLADALIAYQNLGKTAASTERDKIKNVEILWAQGTRHKFIDQLAEIVRDQKESHNKEADRVPAPPQIFDQIKRSVAKEMAADSFPLFRSLLRFTVIYRDQARQTAAETAPEA
jgi:hypothetical protein